MSIIQAIKEETAVGQAMQEYARLQAEIRYHQNMAEALKTRSAYVKAKKLISSTCKCNDGKMVIGAMKATLVTVKEHIVKEYEYVRISGLPKEVTAPPVVGILAGITPEQWDSIRSLFSYELQEA